MAFVSKLNSNEILKNLDKIQEIEEKTIYVCSTPIGNIYDISLRQLFILTKATVIFAEDTRVLKKLLMLLSIDFKEKKIIHLDEFTYKKAINFTLQNPSEIYALVSDRGTPNISDPGVYLLSELLNYNFKFSSISGSSSVIASLSLLPTKVEPFLFLGFLKKKKETEVLKYLKQTEPKKKKNSINIVFFESNHRIKKTLLKLILELKELYLKQELTKKTNIFLFCDITKYNEQMISIPFELYYHISNNEINKIFNISESKKKSKQKKENKKNSIPATMSNNPNEKQDNLEHINLLNEKIKKIALKGEYVVVLSYKEKLE